MGLIKTSRFRVVVDKERLQASLVFTPGDVAEGLTQEELIGVAREAGIKSGPDLEKQIGQLVSMAQEGRYPETPVVIARGRPSDPGKDGWFELDPGLRFREHIGTDSVNHFTQRRIITVAADQVIGKVHPPRPPEDGEDVFGQPIRPAAKRCCVHLGKNVRLGEDGLSVVAARAGHVKHDSQNVEVIEVLTVPGDVDFSSGSIDAPGDVIIRGSVQDLFRVQTRKSIEVGGNIEAADVRAGANILVHGGICGKEKGRVVCGGELRTRFCHGAHIEAHGDVHIAKEAIHSNITTYGALLIPNGNLIGGRTHARNGGHIGVLGSEAGVKTYIGIGMNVGRLDAIAEIDEKIKMLKEAADQTRRQVRPLLADLRRLPPRRREMAAELLCRADDLDQQRELLGRQKEKLLEQATPVGAALTVNSRICAAVIITVDHFHLRIDNELRGPIRIEKRKIENVTEVVGVHPLTGSLTILPARKIEPSHLRATAHASA
jgi:uncharacterized protein (DUF342 family)